MERLVVIFVGIILLMKWDVESLEVEDEFFGGGNGTRVSYSLVESMSYLESVYGLRDAVPPANALMVPLTLIQGARAKGAAYVVPSYVGRYDPYNYKYVFIDRDNDTIHGTIAKKRVNTFRLQLAEEICLDGTLPGYHFHPGSGSGANSWLIQLEGGGWCNNVRTCVYRKTTRRGSSNYFEKQIPFTGILSNKPQENPDFFNWNRVKIRYCDGASFSGDSEHKAAGLQFRGQRIWQAAMEELFSNGMRNVKQALLSGCSAGGLASILHCDEFRDLLPPTTKVKCLSDAGLFMDAADVSGGHIIRDFFGGVVSLQGVEKNLPSTCTKHLNPTSCFFPQNLITNIKTPLFILNAAYDSWQVLESLAPPKADPQGKWSSCRKNIAQCSVSQIQFLQGFRNQMLNAIKGFATSPQSGLFINSCFLHCQSEVQTRWFGGHSPSIGGKKVATSVGDWYFDRVNVKVIDCAYPCDRTCH